MPPRDMYDPKGMNAKKKTEFEKWYDEQLNSNYVFNLRQDMESYCVSDVKLLKAGCEAFQQEFESHGNSTPWPNVLPLPQPATVTGARCIYQQTPYL